MSDSKNVSVFTDANFKAEVLESDKPVLIDFWAPWCGPCLAIGPMIEQVADEYVEKIKVGRVNVDENIGVANGFAISAIPTLLFVKGGKVVDQIVGVSDKKKISDSLDKML